MKERPILFSGPMVRAILEGRKTVTRRIVKPQPHDFIHAFSFELHPFASSTFNGTPAEGIAVSPERKVWVMEDWCKNVVGIYGRCKYGQPGDRLWVRETWRCRGGREYEYQKHQPSILYRCDAEVVDYCTAVWRPSIFMPRWASRITLEIESVRVERLHDITEEDAKAEGVSESMSCGYLDNGTSSCSPRCKFKNLWQSINGKGSWDLNPWVWMIQFKRLEAK